MNEPGPIENITCKKCGKKVSPPTPEYMMLHMAIFHMEDLIMDKRVMNPISDFFNQVGAQLAEIVKGKFKK